MRKWFSILLIVIGVGCCVMAIYPIFEMNQKVNESLHEWEGIKAQHQQSNVDNKELLVDGVIGTLKFPIMITLFQYVWERQMLF